VDGTPANALFRIDNCQFNSPGDLTAINTWGGGRGVIDHCWFESDGTHYGAFICHYPEQSTAGTTSYGITDHTGTVDMVMLALEIKE
jgi:hypothetical protein